MIAAHYVRDCPYVIEIGGYKNPISDFLTHRFDFVLSIDPLIKPRKEKKIWHAQEDFRFFDFKPFVQEPYALVLLGMDLPFDFKLFHLAASAKRVIIEFPQGYAPSLQQFELLQSALQLKVELQMGLDVSGNDFGVLHGSHPVFPYRQMYVLSTPTAHTFESSPAPSLQTGPGSALAD